MLALVTTLHILAYFTFYIIGTLFNYVLIWFTKRILGAVFLCPFSVTVLACNVSLD